DFVIIGAQRAGTTSLFRSLAAHPDGGVPSEKELHFFTFNFGRGADWYREQFPVDAPLTGEATPYYVFHPRAHERMAALVPDAKLIVVLRNPADRAYSHWAFVRAEGHEDLPFEAALEAEERRLAGEVERMLADDGYYSYAHQYHSYLARGRYAEQLERWFAAFARNRFLVLRSEDLYREPARVYDEVMGFLGLRPWTPPAFERYNPSDAIEMDEATRRSLEARFAPLNARLYELLGRDMRWGSSGRTP
ncbi:MAG TPA: sulfotransferase domain-containing protein, partial [Actinomycetota bacterium]|nr:sulfotransferase domain-containing protein [Actinomycetota bacterium]